MNLLLVDEAIAFRSKHFIHRSVHLPRRLERYAHVSKEVLQIFLVQKPVDRLGEGAEHSHNVAYAHIRREQEAVVTPCVMLKEVVFTLFEPTNRDPRSRGLAALRSKVRRFAVPRSIHIDVDMVRIFSVTSSLRGIRKRKVHRHVILPNTLTRKHTHTHKEN